ncbi:MAG: hypothetical protein HYX78_05465 [Armatimonadetes bacterium]|nr:hypothetical protein [Armatimonadota bacterium]
MRIVVTGLIGQYPVAGMTAHYIQWVVGLRNLGHDVYYIEDNGACPYNPVTQSVDIDYSYSAPYLVNVMESFGLKDRWAYMTCDGDYYGLGGPTVRELLRTADLFVNISSATLPREEHLACPLRVHIDTDPAFLQFRMMENDNPDFFNAHQIHFTYAENIGRPGCSIPTGKIDWQPCRQPVVLEMWPVVYSPRSRRFTTIANWNVYGGVTFRGETYGDKEVEIIRFIGLPPLVDQPLEFAIAATPDKKEMLKRHGWRVRDPRGPAKDLASYRNYIARSRAEFSLAKNAYVKTRSGWFSERSACYLGTGKPVLLQDTGFSDWLPVDKGVIPFSTIEEAVTGIERINRDYRLHCAAARRVAEEYFASGIVLGDFLRRCGD